MLSVRGTSEDQDATCNRLRGGARVEFWPAWESSPRPERGDLTRQLRNPSLPRHFVVIVVTSLLMLQLLLRQGATESVPSTTDSSAVRERPLPVSKTKTKGTFLLYFIPSISHPYFSDQSAPKQNGLPVYKFVRGARWCRAVVLSIKLNLSSSPSSPSELTADPTGPRVRPSAPGAHFFRVSWHVPFWLHFPFLFFSFFFFGNPSHLRFSSQHVGLGCLFWSPVCKFQNLDPLVYSVYQCVSVCMCVCTLSLVYVLLLSKVLNVFVAIFI